MILVCISSMANAQSWFNNLEENTKDFFRYKFLKKEYTEIGIQVGGAGYIGDMNNHVFSADNKSVLGFNSYSIGASAKHYFNPISARDRTWGIRLDYNFSRLKGNDAYSSDLSHVNRKLQFKNYVHEIAAMGEFHFYEFRPNRMRNLVSPYVFAGVGMIYHNPKAKDPNGKNVSLIDEIVEARKIKFDETEGTSPDLTKYPFGNIPATSVEKYSKTAFIMPVGAGIKISGTGLWTPISFGIELNYRFVFHDFLDGVGNNKYHHYSAVQNWLRGSNLSKLQWEQLAGSSIMLTSTSPQSGPYSGSPDYAKLIGTKRGDKGNDSYMTAAFRVTYTFYKWRDPLWKNPNARRR